MSLFRWEKTRQVHARGSACARAPCVCLVQAFTWGKFYGQILRNRLFRRAWQGKRGGGGMGDLVDRWASVCRVCAFLFRAPGPRVVHRTWRTCSLSANCAHTSVLSLRRTRAVVRFSPGAIDDRVNHKSPEINLREISTPSSEFRCDW